MFTLFNKEDKNAAEKVSLVEIEALVDTLRDGILRQYSKLVIDMKKDSVEKKYFLHSAMDDIDAFKATDKSEEKSIEKALVMLMMKLYQNVMESEKIEHTGKLSGSLAKVGISIDSDTTKVLKKAYKEVGEVLKVIGAQRNKERIKDAGEWFEKHDATLNPIKKL